MSVKFIALKCPNCGGKLEVEQEERATCIHCGYEFLIDDGKPEIHNHYYNNNYQAQKRNNYPIITEKKPSKSNNWVVILISLIFFIFFCIFIIMPDMFNDSPKATSMTTDYRTVPESKAIRTMSEYIFGKKCETISSEEFSTIKYLKVGKTGSAYDDWEFIYSFEDYYVTPNFEDTKKRIYFTGESNEDIYSEDFQCFTGLTALELDGSTYIRKNSGYSETDLSNLKNLTYYSASHNQSLTSIDNCLYDKNQIKKLSIQLRSQSDVEELLNYENLENLTITYFGDDVKDYSPISKLTKLTSLTLETYESSYNWLSSVSGLKELRFASGYNITDFSGIFGLTQLERLEIHSASNLKSLSFVSNMPKLASLTVSGSPLINLNDLENKSSLVYLDIRANYDIDDCKALATLVSLKEFYCNDTYTMLPDLTHLTNLEKVATNSKTLSMLNSETIKDLRLEISSSSDFSCSELSVFTNLEKLYITSNYITDSETFSNLTKLKYLTIDEVSINNKGAELSFFNHPAIETLVLNDVTLDIDRSLYMKNNVIKNLTISNCSYWEDYADGNFIASQLYPGDFTDLLSSFEAVECLSLQNSRISDLSFASTLKNLKYLNIKDNYVTDVSPLVELEYLEELDCENNPITNIAALPEEIRVLR